MFMSQLFNKVFTLIFKDETFGISGKQKIYANFNQKSPKKRLNKFNVVYFVS